MTVHGPCAELVEQREICPHVRVRKTMVRISTVTVSSVVFAPPSVFMLRAGWRGLRGYVCQLWSMFVVALRTVTEELGATPPMGLSCFVPEL